MLADKRAEPSSMVPPTAETADAEIQERASMAGDGQKYLLPLLPDSGPGNQIVCLKESMIMARRLGRCIVFPPIRQHFTRGKKYWRFLDIFSCDLNSAAVDAKLVGQQVTAVYCAYSGALNRRLAVEDEIGLPVYEEHLLDPRYRCCCPWPAEPPSQS
jgi:hypothetical protein